MNIHVTGTNGFIAQHLMRTLKQRGHFVAGNDINEWNRPDVAFRLFAPDFPDVIVHAGALVGRVRGAANIIDSTLYNTASTALWAEFCAENGIPLVYLSTSEVYGGRTHETSAYEYDVIYPARLHNLYALTKKWGEDAIDLYAPPSTICRLSMPYGPGHPPGVGRAALTNFIYNAALGEPLTVHRGARRSWLWIGDCVDGIVRIIEQKKRGKFNIARDDNEMEMLDVARLVIRMLESNSEIRIITPPKGYTLTKRLDNRLLTDLGWSPKVSLAEGIRHTYAWMVDRGYLAV